MGQPNPFPVQLNPKRPQIHLLQNDRFSCDGDSLLFEIHLNLVELLLNGQEIVKDVALAGHEMTRLGLQFAHGAIQLAAQRLEFAAERALDVRRGRRPAHPAYPLGQLRKPAAAEPGFVRQLDLAAHCAVGCQALVNPGRCAEQVASLVRHGRITSVAGIRRSKKVGAAATGTVATAPVF